jgi:hypothetical protein
MSDFLAQALFILAVVYCSYCFTGLFHAILELIK